MYFNFIIVWRTDGLWVVFFPDLGTSVGIGSFSGEQEFRRMKEVCQTTHSTDCRLDR